MSENTCFLSDMAYAVVVFLEDKSQQVDLDDSIPDIVQSVSVVCMKWLRSMNVCLWPNTKNANVVINCLRLQSEPQPDWQTYKIRVLQSGIGKSLL